MKLKGLAISLIFLLDKYKTIPKVSNYKVKEENNNVRTETLSSRKV